MIYFDKFFIFIKNNNISQYSLIKKHEISPDTIKRMKRNEPVTTYTLDKICNVLNCNLWDIMEFVPNSNYTNEKKENKIEIQKENEKENKRL